MSRPRLVWSALFASTVGLGLVGCPPSLEDPQAFETSCPAGFDVEALFQSQCAFAGCHAAGASAAAGLDLESADPFDRMYDAPSSCGPLLVSPAGPSESLLLAKLEGTAPCGSRMPLGRAPLSASDIDCVAQWITDEIAAGPPLGTGGGGAGGSGLGGSGLGGSGLGGSGLGGSGLGGSGGATVVATGDGG